MYLTANYPPAGCAGSKVLLDGVELLHCCAADDEEGWAALYDESGQYTIVRGKVEFVFTPATMAQFSAEDMRVYSRHQQQDSHFIKIDKRVCRLRFIDETEDGVIIVIDRKEPFEGAQCLHKTHSAKP